VTASVDADTSGGDPEEDDLAQATATAAALLARADDVTLLAHVRPDADALGSALALGRALQRRGATVRVSFGAPDTMPETLRPLDVHGLFVPASQVPAAPPVLVTCDVNEPARLGPLADRLGTAGVTVMLDHHITNPGFGDVRILDPAAEATVMLVHGLLRTMGEEVDENMARCLYAGLVTDTRNFRDAGPAAHRLAAELIEAGADPHALVTPIMDTHPFPWLAVLADLLRTAELDPGAAGGFGMVHTVIPAEHVFRFRQEEVDGVVDTLRTAAEAEVAAVVKQVGPTRWTVSLRAKGRVDVAAAAAALGGGGHPRAAGVTLDGTAGEVVAALRAVL
jgi:bifunctional oligoribonuclease and PAP phosphatase NrnA